MSKAHSAAAWALAPTLNACAQVLGSQARSGVARAQFLSNPFGDAVRARASEEARRLEEMGDADETVPRDGAPYMLRWYLESLGDGRRYVHKMLEDDRDAPHDHPWGSIGWVVRGTLIEEWWDNGEAARKGQPPHRERLEAGMIALRPAEHVHRLLVAPGHADAVTVFCTGSKMREWGFWAPRGWVHWREYTQEA